MKVAFLDRDGTIVADYPDALWPNVGEPEFLPGAIEALEAFQGKGYQFIIVTNQYLIGEGLITQAQYDAFTAKMLRVLAGRGVRILDVFYCPHRRNSGCVCMKPRPGMIEAALAKYPGIDLTHSFLVGGSPGDIELAERIGFARAFSIGFDSGRSGATRVTSLGDVVSSV
jgi:D-glycero-D-manno-heptose 1,7-bisphosphate phosphatase